MKNSEKKQANSLKKGERAPLLNFIGDPGVPLLNFEGGPAVLRLSFRGVPGPIFKLWGWSRIQSPRVLTPLLHHASSSVYLDKCYASVILGLMILQNDVNENLAS